MRHEDDSEFDTPEWISKNTEFDAEYEPIINLQYRIDREPWKKRTQGDWSRRRCSLCEDPKTSFSNDSHLIPVSLGNRKYFSWEECDKCNEKYANLDDDHLAKMLLPERLFGKIPGRDGYPILKLSDQYKSTIKWSENLEKLLVHDTFMIEESEHSFLIKFPLQPHKIFNSLRSIMRSAWLAMSLTQRARHKRLGDIITQKMDVAETEYVWLSLDPGLNSVLLDCWQKKVTSKHRGPQLIIRFCILNSGIIWCLPEENSSFSIPALLPEFPEQMRSESDLRKVSSADQEVSERIVRYVHSGKHEAEEDTENETQTVPQRPRDYPEESASMRFSVDDTSDSFYLENLTLRYCQLSRAVERYKIFGGKLTGELTFHRNILNNKSYVEIDLQPIGKPLADVKQTMLLFRDILCKGGSVEILANPSQKLRLAITVNQCKKSVEIENSANNQLKFVESLIFLSKYNSALTLPTRSVSQQDHDAIVSLAELIKAGYVESLGDTIEMVLPVGAVLTLMNLVGTKKGTIVMAELSPFTVLGQEIKIGDDKAIENQYIEFEFCEETLAMEEQIRSRPGKDAIRVSFRCSKQIRRLTTERTALPQ